MASANTTLLVPESDDRLYRVIRLENEMQVMLISDPASEKAGASMDVHVGSFFDPEEVPGLAHFLEHMLFLGTEKYPNESEYGDFINEHGGQSNAFTAAEDTNYYFEINANKLEGALDRFAQFFVTPLFTETATEREMNAVDSEHSKNLQSDMWREDQLMHSTASKEHPYSKFGTGSLETLKSRSDIREQLLKFHETYYSSNIMKLCILGQEPLDQLEKWARDMFSAVKNKHVTLPKFNGKPFTQNELRKRFNIVPVQDLRTVDLCWPIPGQHTLYTKKPAHYLSHLTGHEGPGSILSLLKNKGWATALVAGPTTSESDFALFKINVGLTPEGEAHVNDIIAIVFQYISLIKKEGVTEQLFGEIRQLAEMGFRFKDKEEPFRYLPTVAQNMQVYPEKYILAGDHLNEDYDPELIHQTLAYFTPENLRVHLISTKFEGNTDKEERWYKVNYSEEAISDEEIKQWLSAPLEKELHLPAPNPFIPDDFTIKSPTEKFSSTVPILLRSDNKMKLWFKQDTTFKLPRAILNFEINSPVAYESPAAVVMSKLFCKLLTDSLNEFAYDADIAGLSYALSNTVEGLALEVKGYNCKQHILVKKVFEKLATLQFEDARFFVLREAASREYKNFLRSHPYSLATYKTSVSLESVRWTFDEYIQVVDAITPEQLREFIPRLLKQLFVEMLFLGNITHKEALSMLAEIESVLSFNGVWTGQLPERRVAMLPVNTPVVYQMKVIDPKQINHAIENVYTVDVDNMKDMTLLELFNQIIQADCFNQLRTVEQLGYIVFSGIKVDCGVLGFRVIVQSSVKDPAYLDERIENFLASVKDNLGTLSEEEWTNHCQSLIARKLEKDKSLKQEAERFWKEVANPHTYWFERDAKEAALVETLKKDDIIAFYEHYVSPLSKNRRKLSTRVYNNSTEMPTALPDTIIITDANTRAFKRSQSLFPLLYTGLDQTPVITED
jgi:insulysin